MRTVALKLLLLLASTLIGLVLVEQILRAVDFEYRPMSIDVGNRGDARLFHLFEDDHFVYDPRLIWRPRSAYGVFNEQGYRGPVLALEKPLGVTRVFAVGDSNTLGWAGEGGANWPGLLGKILRTLEPHTELVNGGVWGYSSYQGRLRVRDAMAFSPDVVLISFGSNDAHRVPRSDREFASESLLGRASARWLLHYRTAQLVATVWDRLGLGERRPRPRVGLDEYRENLSEMASEARAGGALPVFLTRPYTGPVNDPEWWKAYGHQYNRATVEVAERVEAPVVDLYTLFREHPELFSDESHFTAEGHERAARIVAQHLLPILLREKPSFGSRRGPEPAPTAR